MRQSCSIRHPSKNLRYTYLGRIGQGRRRGHAKSENCKVSSGQCLLQLALDGRHFQDLVQVARIQDLHGTRRTLFPRIVIHLLHKLVARIVADLLEELTEEMGEERTGHHNALVRVGIAVIEGDLFKVGQEQPTNHGGNDQDPACIQNLGRRCLSTELDVRQQLCRQEVTNICALVLLGRSILQMICEVRHGILLTKDSKFCRVTEGGTEQLDVRICVGPPDERGNLEIGDNTECLEIDHDRNVFAEPGHARRHGKSESIELGTQTNLQFLRRSCKGFVQRLELDGEEMLGRRPLVLEDHDPIICNLLLAQDGALRSMNHKVPEWIARTLAQLLDACRVILQQTERRPQHDRHLADGNAIKDVGLLRIGIKERTLVRPCHKAHVHVHLCRIRKVTRTCLHWQHGFDTTRCLLQTGFHVGHILKRQLELVLVLLGRFILLVPNGDGGRRLHDQRDLGADKVFKRLDLMVDEASDTVLRKVSSCSVPLHAELHWIPSK